MRRAPSFALVCAAILLAASAACGGGDEAPAEEDRAGGPITSPLATQAATAGERVEGRQDMRLTSTAFEPGEPIPQQYSCDGADISPPLAISDVPGGTVALALVMDDPDAPVGTWDHWVAFNLPVVETIAEDAGSVGTDGRNSWGNTGYGGPCPPGGTHRYFFRLYALDAALDLDEGAGKQQVLSAIEGHVLAEAELMGTYSRE